MQSFITDRRRLGEILRWSRSFAGLDGEIDRTLTHLLDNRWLIQRNDQLVLGPESHHRFGGRGGANALLATFSVADAAQVETEDGTPVGSVDWEQVGDEGSARRRDN